jgi:hypothetical protein
MLEQELIELLMKYKIPYDTWGTGQTKTVLHLLHEVNTGESRLEEQNLQLYRIVSIAVLNVFCLLDAKRYQLFETRQVYTDGRVAIRNLKDSLYEKLLPDEDPLAGAYRALNEELGIDTKLAIVDKGVTLGVREAISYPGLITKDTQYSFEVIIPLKEYKPNGYIETQKDKTNFFEWKEVY